MSAHRRILLSMLIINVVGAFVIFFYFAYIDLETLNANKAFWRGTRQDWTAFALVMSLLGIFGIWIASRYGRLLRVQAAHLTISDPSHENSQRVRRRAASYPLIIALISLGIWLLAGVFFAQGGSSFVTVTPKTFWRTFVGIVVIGGLTASTLIYLTTDNIWRRQLPIFFPSGDVSRFKFGRISVGQRLVATFLLTGLVPLLTLGAASRNSVVNMSVFDLTSQEVLRGLQLTILFIVSIGIVSNVLLSILTARSLLLPLRRLTEAMKKIGGGNLNLRLPVTSNDELGDLTNNFNQMMAELEQGQKMRDLFGRYVSKEVAEQVLRNGGDLGGENVSATALFADIRDFTGLAERLPPQVVVDILNRYYTRMVDVIVAEGGLVNKFGGDSLLAIFGVPIRQSDHALRAVRAAWHMTRALADFNSEQAALDLPPLMIGIGISSGDMVAGNIGGQQRIEYTVIGDPVNLASRLQSLTKEWRKTVLLSEHTQLLLDQETVEVSPCEEVAVRGKQQSTLVYELRGLKGVGAGMV